MSASDVLSKEQFHAERNAQWVREDAAASAVDMIRARPPALIKRIIKTVKRTA